MYRFGGPGTLKQPCSQRRCTGEIISSPEPIKTAKTAPKAPQPTATLPLPLPRKDVRKVTLLIHRRTQRRIQKRTFRIFPPRLELSSCPSSRGRGSRCRSRPAWRAQRPRRARRARRAWRAEGTQGRDGTRGRQRRGARGWARHRRRRRPLPLEPGRELVAAHPLVDHDHDGPVRLPLARDIQEEENALLVRLPASQGRSAKVWRRNSRAPAAPRERLQERRESQGRALSVAPSRVLGTMKLEKRVLIGLLKVYFARMYVISPPMAIQTHSFSQVMVVAGVVATSDWFATATCSSECESLA